MVRLLTDENFNDSIVHGLKLRLPLIDVVSVRQVGLAGLPDPTLLKWAAQEERTILTHDISTMIPDANQLLKWGEPMAGVILVPDQLEIGRAIRDLELLLECLSQSETAGPDKIPTAITHSRDDLKRCLVFSVSLLPARHDARIDRLAGSRNSLEVHLITCNLEQHEVHISIV